MRHTLSIICALLLFASCSSPSDKANKLVNLFANATNTEDSVTIVKAYPNASKFFAELPNLTELQIVETSEKNNSVVVECQSSYYDENCVFVQKPLTFMVQEVDGEYRIVDSKGLLTVSDGLNTFALKTGAVTPNSTDVEINAVRKDLGAFFLEKYWLRSLEINIAIKKVSFSWEADYGTPNGKCTIKNTLPFAVKNVTYKIKYYCGDELVGSDDGTAAYELDAGALKSFTFYSSGVNGYRAQTARITFEVPDKYIMEWILNDTYDGTEFAEYVNSKQK